MHQQRLVFLTLHCVPWLGQPGKKRRKLGTQRAYGCVKDPKATPEQIAGTTLCPPLSYFPSLSSLTCALSLSLSFFPHPYISLLSSCRRGKPQSSWPVSPSASRLASLLCRGPCQSSSGSSHALLYESFHCTSAMMYLLGLKQYRFQSLWHIQ